MMGNWQSLPFEECIEPVVYTAKVQRKCFLTEGAYPIVSQEEAFINGFWDEEADLFRVERPLVVFGDHTRALKYIDFDFVLGADGIKVLKPKPFLHPRFFYYQLHTAKLASLGYARHYRLLKEHQVAFPAYSEQQRVVAILDEAFDGIATVKANAEKNLQNARNLFQHLLQATFDAEVTWPVQQLGTLCTQVTDGTHNSPPYVETGVAMLDSKHIGDDFEIDDSRAEKFISPDVDAQLAQRCKPGEGDILISSRGTIGKIAIVQAGQDFNIMGNMILLRLPPSVDRHFIAFYVLSRVAHIESIARGVAQKGLYLGQVRDYEVPVPPIDEQRQIAKRLRWLQMESARLCEVINRKLEALEDLKNSLLNQAFTGALTDKSTNNQLEAVA